MFWPNLFPKLPPKTSPLLPLTLSSPAPHCATTKWSWPLRPNPHLGTPPATASHSRRQRHPPCPGDSQWSTSTAQPVLAQGQRPEQPGTTAPRACRPCRRRPQSAHCPRVHKPPLDTSPRPPLQLDLENTLDTSVRRPKPHSHRSPWTQPLQPSPRPHATTPTAALKS